MKVFIEEVLQVLAIEIVGVGCMTGRTVTGVAVLPTLKGANRCPQVENGKKID